MGDLTIDDVIGQIAILYDSNDDEVVQCCFIEERDCDKEEEEDETDTDDRRMLGAEFDPFLDDVNFDQN